MTTLRPAPAEPPAEPEPSSTDGQSAGDRPLHVERRGIEHVPLAERWARPRDVGGMWAGASLQVEYFIYGAVLMTFGFSFVQSVWLILVGNLSYFLLGICSLQGPQAGTTTFAINRAPFGTAGSRPISFLNWATQIGFEVEGLLLIVGAGLGLSTLAGLHPGTQAKVALVVGAVAVQVVLPFLGHATILKTLRLLVLPFAVIFLIMLALGAPHFTLHGVSHGADWQLLLEGLAFTITLSGLGWTENGNDYTRYCAPDVSKRAVVGWVFAGTAIPQILLMLLGAAVGTFITSIGTAGNAFLPLVHQHTFPSWFVAVFLLLAVMQLFAVNSLDLYSSGVTLQALGAPVRRYHAVLIDCLIAFCVTLYAILNSSFNAYLKDFVALVIVWIAPWAAIYVTDWVLRRFAYAPLELQRTDRQGLYHRRHGWFWPAVVAQLVGMVAALSSLATTFHLPAWLNSVTWATRDAQGYGADVSVFMGMGVAALVYAVLGWRGVRRQADEQERLLREVPAGPAAPGAPAASTAPAAPTA